MQQEILYLNKLPLRILFLFAVISGASLLFVFIYLFKIKVYLDIYSFAGPLLGLAMLFTGLRSAKIKRVTLHNTDGVIEILKESLFDSKSNNIGLNKLTVQLKLASGKKDALIPKIKLVFLSEGKQIEKMESGFLSLNNKKIKNLYYDLKSILQSDEATYV